MSLTTTLDPPATWPSSNPDLPPDFDPDLCPIIAEHWFGLNPRELREVREVFWSLARQGHRLPAESDLIVIRGGQS